MVMNDSQNNFEHIRAKYGLYLTEDEVSLTIKRAKGTLRNDRFNGRGIPYVKFGNGRAVRYALQDVIDFMNHHKIATSDA